MRQKPKKSNKNTFQIIPQYSNNSQYNFHTNVQPKSTQQQQLLNNVEQQMPPKPQYYQSSNKMDQLTSHPRNSSTFGSTGWKQL